MFDADAIARDVIGRALANYQRIGRRLYRSGSGDPPADPLQSSPLRDDILLLVRIANGDIDRATIGDQGVGAVVEAVERVVELLFARAGEPHAHHVPASFWSQPGIGQALAHVQVWLRRDDLIGYTDAAQMLFGELAAENIQAARMRVKRLVERGMLMAYAAPGEANPTRRARVSRQAAEALRDAGAAA
ncbi:MAG: hypothetical protein ACJ8CR_03285 [Roseiflexaceae bacterium]